MLGAERSRRSRRGRGEAVDVGREEVVNVGRDGSVERGGIREGVEVVPALGVKGQDKVMDATEDTQLKEGVGRRSASRTVPR